MPFENSAFAVMTLSGDMVTRTEPDIYAFEGYVDFYGYHAASGGWFFGGWIAHPWPAGNRPEHVTAHFAEASVAEHMFSAFYHRADVERRGIGFVFFLRAPPASIGALQRLAIDFTHDGHDMLPTQHVRLLQEDELAAELQPILAGGEDASQRRKMLSLLQGGRSGATSSGFVECYGYHAAAGGWLICGWVARGWGDGPAPSRVLATFEQGDVSGDAVAMLFTRHDLKDGAEGVIIFVQGAGRPLGGLCSVSYVADGVRGMLYPGHTAQRLREPELIARLRPTLTQAPPDPARDHLTALLARQPYVGLDTLGELSEPVSLEIDEAIVCEPDGLVLIGWCAAAPGVIREIRVRCGNRMANLDLRRAVAIARPDVVATLGMKYGLDDPRCGFVAYVPQAIGPGESIYLEIETQQREIGFRAVPPSRLSGLAAIKRVLELVDARFGDLPQAFDMVLGPAVQLLNRTRLHARQRVEVADYGTLPARPAFSVIVPLYGRLDFVEYQLAIFSAHPGASAVEFIYVLDDPDKRREAERLFARAYEVYGLAFRALLLERNVGFATANAFGLEQARGAYVAFLNSDVFPGTPDWLERLSMRLDADPTLGVVGPMLLYEDGTVQHQGIHFAALREFGNWLFPQHTGKGLRAQHGGGLRDCLCITGACMVMRRDLARQIGGFDETYAISDFEDTDLCLKLRALGYGSAVDHDVRLYHLERKSQAASAIGWRMNLTLFNAWQHQRRWATTITALQAGHA
jgi:GT2 family glycosyltransferase